MEKIWSGWKRRHRLRRGQKLGINLILIALLLVYCWGLAGYPLPTLELELRRWERSSLMHRREVVFAVQKNQEIPCAGGQPLFPVQDQLVAVGEGWAAVNRPGDRWAPFELYPLEEELSPVPLFGGHVGWIPEPGISRIDLALLVLRVPEEAVWGEIAVKIESSQGVQTCSGSGWDTGHGIWMFAIQSPEGGYAGNWYEHAPYTLRLYREDGFCWEKTGELPAAESIG